MVAEHLRDVRPRTAFLSSPQQFQLFARKAIIEFPPKQQSADSLGEVEADDNCLYYVKGDAHGRSVRASEWICTQIAEAIGIAAPAPAVIELQDGSTVFGSRRIAGVADAAITTAYLTSSSASNAGIPAQGLKSLLSKIYALDMFLNNTDRHLGNYLSVDDNGVRRLYAFDFSRALFWEWPWVGYPSADVHTRTWGSVLRRLHGFDIVAANSTISGLGALAPAAVEGFINQMPEDWISIGQRSQFMAAWTDGAFQVRLDGLRKGFTDGSLL